MNTANLVTDAGKTDPPRSTIGEGEKSEHPRTPLTPGRAAELFKVLKDELEVANEHWTTVKLMLSEMLEAEQDEKQLLSAEVDRLRAVMKKREEYVVSVVKEVEKLKEHVGHGYKELYLKK